MKALFILNDPPIRQRADLQCTATRTSFAEKDPQKQLTVFLMADSVVAAKAGQKTPDDYYNIERMLKRVLAGNGKVLLCRTCMDGRGIDDAIGVRPEPRGP
jgi:uncharacterized protein involved in oxidation of intracellular sulfur